MKAVIMAGGEGTRLRPMTSNQPKPMLPMANKPMMEHVVMLLKKHGFDEIVVTVAFMANAIRTYFGDGSEFGVQMVYATEETPLGTAGSVYNAKDKLDEQFLVISGDVLTDIDLTKVLSFHNQNRALATIALKSLPNPLEFGIVITKEDGTIERFLEKPTWGQVFSDTINAGIYVLEPEIFDFIPPDKPSDFSADVFPLLLKAKKPLYGYIAEGYWEDVGTLQAYLQAHKDILDGKVGVDVAGFALRPSIWLEEGAEVHPDVEITGPVLIGANSRIADGANLGEYTVIGANVTVGPGALLQRCIVHDNSYLGPGIRLLGCVIGHSCDLREGVECGTDAVLGEECFVGAHAQISAGIKVYPFKTVEAGATVNSSIVWESKGARNLFGRQGVSGLANVDLTPELAVRLSMAYAATLPKGATVTCSRDSSRSARALKRAMMVGLNLAGVNVSDLEAATVPLTRFQTRISSSQGGITVRLLAGDLQSVIIKFFDSDGIDINEAAQRKIERLFYREDFRRAPASEIGDIDFPSRALEFYTLELMKNVNVEAIRSAEFKIVLDYSYGTASFVMPVVLSKLGAEVLVINPYASTKEILSFDKSAHAAGVAELVKSSGAQLGAVIYPGGDHIAIIDDTGRLLTNDEALVLLLSLLINSNRFTSSHRPVIALPVAASRAAEEICKNVGGQILWTKLSDAHLMETANLRENKVDFAASQAGGFIFPRFLPAYDAVATLVNLLELLSSVQMKISDILSAIPAKAAIVHKGVVTPITQKGAVMRSLMERVKNKKLVLIDGIKIIEDDTWVLIVPDPEDPITHIWAEASSMAHATTLRDRYATLIEQFVS